MTLRERSMVHLFTELATIVTLAWKVRRSWTTENTRHYGRDVRVYSRAASPGQALLDLQGTAGPRRPVRMQVSNVRAWHKALLQLSTKTRASLLSPIGHRYFPAPATFPGQSFLGKTRDIMGPGIELDDLLPTPRHRRGEDWMSVATHTPQSKTTSMM